MIGTVFIDRDGVVNRRLMDDYIKDWSEFELLPGVREALLSLKSAGWRTVLITNQRGVSLGIMTREELLALHERMQELLGDAALDAIYFCPHGKDDGCACRKPRPGMILQAAADFPDIQLDQCCMFGDSDSDGKAAFNAGCPRFFKIVEGYDLLAAVKDWLAEHR